MKAFLTKAVGRLVVALAVTYALIAVVCILLGWPFEMATTYMAFAAAGGGVALVVAIIRHRTAQMRDRVPEIADKPSLVRLAFLFFLGLLLVAIGLLLVARYDVQEGSFLLIVGASLIVSCARSAARLARAE